MSTTVNTSTNTVTISETNDSVQVTDNNTGTSVNITGNDVSTITVSDSGIQGPTGPAGQDGAAGSVSDYSGTLSGDNLNLSGHVTASGNISSSGTITAEHLYSSDDAQIDDDLTVIGDVSIQGSLEINAGDDRPINVGTTPGAIYVRGSSGGWANYFRFSGYSNTNHGGLYGHGNANNFYRWGIASRYDEPTGLHIVSGSGGFDGVGIGTLTPVSTLQVAGDLTATHITASGDISSSGTIYATDIGLDEYIRHNENPTQTYIRITDKRFRFNAGGINYLDMNDNVGPPRDITFNDGGNNVDFKIKGSSNNPLFATDASKNKIGMHGVGSPSAGLHIADDLWVSGSNGHITASGNISSSGELIGTINGGSF